MVFARSATSGSFMSSTVTSHEEEILFSAAFWQACEREAAQLLRGLGGTGDA